MSEPRTRVAAADFTELWRSVSTTTGQQQHVAGPPAATMCTGLRSPPHRGGSRYAGWSNGDSPGDVEPSQDIFWDPSSQTPAAAGLRNTRFVKISDIVNRIAPKDVKRKASECPLLQWIGDSAVPCTAGVPKPRVSKKSSRQTSVDDLLKLARQFDENMQQDRETSERLRAVGDDLNGRADAPETEPTGPRFPGNAEDLKCPPSSDPVEAELRALFDCSTQRVSGRLSQGSSASARSLEVKRQPAAEHRQPELKSSDGSGSGPGSGPPSQPAEGKGYDCDDFDDDWENDDLLNDSFVLAMTHYPAQQQDTHPNTTLQRNTKTNSPPVTSVCKPSANSAQPPPSLNPKPRSLQELCPKPKTSNRRTFKLEPNPHFQTTEVPGSSVAAAQPTSKTSDLKPAAAKTPSIPIPDKTKTCVAAGSSDSLWDDGVDDALLYQACDRVERTSSSQPRRASPGGGGCSREKPAPPPTGASRLGNAGAGRQSPCAFVRSNSLPGSGSGETGNYRGWDVPMKGASNKSQSLPGSRVSLGTFNRCGDSAGTFQSHVAANSKSHQPAFKRSVSDSAATSSKVFVTSQMPLKCSAAEIGRKKQEALARRRQRMQNAPKP